MNYLNETMEKITEFLKSETKIETIIGTEFKLGEFSCVPVMSVGLGFGGGGGEGKGKAMDKSNAEGEGGGAGAGAGMGISPVGFLVTRGDEIQFITSHANKGMSAVFEKIPDLMTTYLDRNKKKEEVEV
ncbi:GerW family sporulation protein [Pedobacter cryophilus]|jgi:uncharacterized spore protein YtfJ|uniref:Sporulation protein n=1 Tax=Pedobacter cryophilus TaxID=2571271 RepID=A0A4V5P095_9SPHI|nr:GerW family sporulation protein [Pedobacter cryophilus]TKB96820.1 sporulation protein [Pedobacter cryophilus]